MKLLSAGLCVVLPELLLYKCSWTAPLPVWLSYLETVGKIIVRGMKTGTVR